MANTQDDREPMGRTTDDEVPTAADAQFEDDELENEDEGEDDTVDAEDLR